MISKEQAEHYNWGQGCDGWHLVKSKQLSIIQERIPPGAGEVKHFHQHAQQFFFILSGRARLTIGETIYELLPHQGCHVAAGCVHKIENDYTEDLIFTVTSTPTTSGDRTVV